MTYGRHHAQSAGALAWLLTNPVEVKRHEMAVVLTCRAALLAAHERRLEQATRGANVEFAMFGTRRRRPHIESLSSWSPVILGELLADVPKHQSHTMALTDALSVEEPSRHAYVWLEAARHATLATESVATSSAWTSRPAQAWQIVTDVADSVEALNILDDRLVKSTGAILPEWAADHHRTRGALRLFASHASMLARSDDLDPRADGMAREERFTGPIPISRPEQIIEGIQASAHLAARSLLSVQELRTFALMQSQISNACIKLLPGDQLNPLRESLHHREVGWRQLAAATPRVASIGTGGGRGLILQTQQIGQALLQSPGEVTPGMIGEVDRYSPALSRVIATNTRRAFDSGRYLVPDENSLEPRWRRRLPDETPSLLSAIDRLGEYVEPVVGADELQWRVDGLARGDRTANQREHDAGSALSMRRFRDSDRPLDVEVESSAERARASLRAVLDRAPLARPDYPNRRPRVSR